MCQPSNLLIVKTNLWKDCRMPCHRYNRHDKRSKLPGWILAHLKDSHLNLSTDMSLHIAREFLRRMAQPYDKAGTGTRKTLLSQADLASMETHANAGF